MREAVVYYVCPMLTTPLEPHQTLLNLTYNRPPRPRGPQRGPRGGVLELIINSFYRSFPKSFPRCFL
jgi:hypothetical protein